MAAWTKDIRKCGDLLFESERFVHYRLFLSYPVAASTGYQQTPPLFWCSVCVCVCVVTLLDTKPPTIVSAVLQCQCVNM